MAALLRVLGNTGRIVSWTPRPAPSSSTRSSWCSLDAERATAQPADLADRPSGGYGVAEPARVRLGRAGSLHRDLRARRRPQRWTVEDGVLSSTRGDVEVGPPG